ncbi:thiol:disulfide interchange protein DsbA/DsbL [Halochromatium glycolicum]|jgi:thiol:disulfide interchange protein DsbA|uniref:Thiol:disulfide interchange protein n=1 Tax=Halochromatium glycolicum TaxID=85075 RepID=A0AAJ0XA96_9GAMM|nr:thiol:disulfide interchange protein DsbA/DsbL [Halochromatium glycolicum]MBK1705604.1 twin-arginine translocation pathway signal protein [Halochromatium glycolicum]
MDAIRRRSTVVMLSLFAFLALPWAPLLAAPSELIEGRHWQPVKTGPAQTDTPEIEVLEFFSYGCPHCGDLNPLIKAWAAELPEDVRFERVPVTFGRAAWESLARLFFTLELAGELERLDQNVFNAVTKQRANLYTKKAILDWVGEREVERAKFEGLFESFAVEAALARASTLAARYRVNAVPMIIVDGRYQVLGEGAKTHRELLGIADRLIEKARAARTADQ